MKTAIAALPVALLLVLGAPAPADDDAIDAALGAHAAGLESASLYCRAWAGEHLAATKDARALAALVRSYGRLPKPRDPSEEPRWFARRVRVETRASRTLSLGEHLRGFIASPGAPPVPIEVRIGRFW